MRRTPVATGITASERMFSSSCGKLSDAASGLALRMLSPNSGPAHWKSCAGAEDSSILYPTRNTSHRRTKTFHSSVETPTFTFGRSNLGPHSTGSGADAVAVGAVF